MPLKRLREKTTTEVLWPYILSLLKTKPRYAYEIRPLIKDKFGFEIGNVTAYMVLYKLELGGYVKTRWEMKEGRQRKYYAITPEGRKTLDEGLDYLRNLTKTLSAA